MNKNIFVACDVSSQKEILDLLSKIHEDISGIKIGLQYITKHSPEEIRELSKFNKPIFYDGKFFDINCDRPFLEAAHCVELQDSTVAVRQI